MMLLLLIIMASNVYRRVFALLPEVDQEPMDLLDDGGGVVEGGNFGNDMATVF